MCAFSRSPVSLLATPHRIRQTAIFQSLQPFARRFSSKSALQHQQQHIFPAILMQKRKTKVWRKIKASTSLVLLNGVLALFSYYSVLRKRFQLNYNLIFTIMFMYQEATSQPASLRRCRTRIWIFRTGWKARDDARERKSIKSIKLKLKIHLLVFFYSIQHARNFFQLLRASEEKFKWEKLSRSEGEKKLCKNHRIIFNISI